MADALVADEGFRELPYNLEAEQALLGALLINNKAAEKVTGFLKAEHFYEPVHGRIYDAVVRLVEKGRTASPLTIKPFFDDDPALEDVGGSAYIIRMAGSAPTVFNPEDYALCILDLAKRRDIIEACRMLAEDAYSLPIDGDAEGLILKGEAEFFALRDLRSISKRWQPLTDTIPRTLAHIKEAARGEVRPGISTGLTDLDAKFGGFQKGKVYILAGRPGMGKSATAGHFEIEAARQDVGVGNFTIEMGDEEQTERYLSDYSERNGAPVEYSNMSKGKVSHERLEVLEKIAPDLAKLPIYIMDDPAISASQVYMQARRLQSDLADTPTPLGLVVVDYLQLMAPETRSGWSRDAEIAMQTRLMKVMARDLDIAVILLSQLNREVEKRDNKRPILADLRESGAIEQDADVVLFLYYDEYYEKKKEPKDNLSDSWRLWQQRMEACHNVLEVIIGKQRNGPTGIERVYFNPGTATLRDLAVR